LAFLWLTFEAPNWAIAAPSVWTTHVSPASTAPTTATATTCRTPTGVSAIGGKAGLTVSFSYNYNFIYSLKVFALREVGLRRRHLRAQAAGGRKLLTLPQVRKFIVFPILILIDRSPLQGRFCGSSHRRLRASPTLDGVGGRVGRVHLPRRRAYASGKKNHSEVIIP
jgi:hypothetical protein